MPNLKTKSYKKALLAGPALFALLGVWFTWMGPGPSMAQMVGPNLPVESKDSRSLTQEISLMGALEEGKLPNQKFADAAALQSFYADRNNAPVWTSQFGRRHVKVEQVLKVLEASWTHGLNPNKYHVERIRELMSAPFDSSRAELELLVSDAIVRYGRDLTGMRINPGDFAQKSRYWRQPLEGQEILKTVSSSYDPSRALIGYVPQGKFYAALRHELVRLSSEPDSDFTPITIKGKIKPGDVNKNIPAIRARLGLPEVPAEVANDYDDDLALKVMEFQRNHNVKADGVIGPQTVAFMNRSREDRINQIVANLERLRWVEQDKPERYVLVNLPSATLWAVDKGEVKLEMDVIIGKKARPTNSFKTEISGVRLNPNWTVPPTIKRADFLPELQADPSVLSRKGIELYQVQNGRSVSIDPHSVDWQNISSKELHSLRMTQAPGDDNPLGKVRVIMENPYNIYLHDTNHRDYFEKDDRALSSGCIRVQKPEALAQFILGENDDWSQEKLDKILASGRMTDVKTDTPVPVYILYQTVWQGENGQIVFGDDVYGQDRRLIEQLGEKEAFHRPEMLTPASLTF